TDEDGFDFTDADAGLAFKLTKKTENNETKYAILEWGASPEQPGVYGPMFEDAEMQEAALKAFAEFDLDGLIERVCRPDWQK
ncbi:hypothetical protein, partial [Salmonella sp. SAL4449]|uniref:hypothetical protein n=1 Tax=Salmonella sp. SAL4449 TaxID=3159904 RepID=UPI00397E19B0